MSITGASLVALISGIASLIGGGISTGKQVSDSNALTRYQEKQKEEEEARKKKEIAQYNKDAKKSAISRAIGSQNVMMPRKQTYTPQTPQPYINPVNVGGIIQGVGSSVGQAAGGLSDMGIGNKPIKWGA
jgi:hypothetical protein